MDISNDYQNGENEQPIAVPTPAPDSSDENKKSAIAAQKPRDEHGHFINPDTRKVEKDIQNENAFKSLFKKHTKVTKGSDDDKILDVEVHNPLLKITKLLEDIKQQKAFSFTLKGSLGITGVVLSLSLLGLFGTQHVLCDKGTQTHSGTIRVLQVSDGEPDSFFERVGQTVDYYKNFANPNYAKPKPKNRVVLMTSENGMIRIVSDGSNKVEDWMSKGVIVTGNYDDCTQTLTLNAPNAIENMSFKGL